MASLNNVILIGRVVNQPELRYTNSGTAFAKFTIAVDRAFSKKDETDFIPLTAWGRLAEICNQYLEKGKLISVKGRLQFNKFEDKEGNKRSAAEVVVEDMQMLTRGNSQGGGTGGDYSSNSGGGSQPAAAGSYAGADDIGMDEVPF